MVQLQMGEMRTTMVLRMRMRGNLVDLHAIERLRWWRATLLLLLLLHSAKTWTASGGMCKRRRLRIVCCLWLRGASKREAA
jgi:hypothetical protein